MVSVIYSDALIALPYGFPSLSYYDYWLSAEDAATYDC